MTPDEILAAFQRNVRRLDTWRGYIGDDEDSPTDDEVHEVLQQARLELAGPRGGARIAEELYLRVAELERQRDAVLALHKHRENHIVCTHDDEIWPCPTATALGVREDETGRPAKPVLLDVSRQYGAPRTYTGHIEAVDFGGER